MAPAGITTVGGTLAAGFVLVRDTVTASAAAPSSVTLLDVVVAPPIVVAGESVRLYRPAVFTVRLVDRETPL